MCFENMVPSINSKTVISDARKQAVGESLGRNRESISQKLCAPLSQKRESTGRYYSHRDKQGVKLHDIQGGVWVSKSAKLIPPCGFNRQS
jgi:hypothetical protein